jgi:hypothetical protein
MLTQHTRVWCASAQAFEVADLASHFSMARVANLLSFGCSIAAVTLLLGKENREGGCFVTFARLGEHALFKPVLCFVL